ncbi:MAG: 4Fe-4S binding protein [Geminicoccaceae bacterium]
MGGERRLPGLLICSFILFLVTLLPGRAADLSDDEAAGLIMPPYQLGARVDDRPLWHVLNAGGEPVGYAFETAPLAPIPGFSGQPVNLLVSLDRDGAFLDVLVLSQNEPVFVSGLGPAPLKSFVRQYRRRSIADNITVGVPYGDAETDISTQVYLDGVSKATASVRIVNETVLAAALKVARERLEGVTPRAARRPRTDLIAAMTFDELLEQGLVSRLTLNNAEIDQAFEGSLWAADDPDARADPGDLYLDLYVADLGIPSVANALVDEETRRLMASAVREYEEPILVMTNGRHPLLDPDFVRNTAPDRIGVRQAGYPIAVRDADVETTLNDGMPDFDQMIMLRLDTRLGFDPGSPYELYLRAVRDHGMFMPERGTRDLPLQITPPERFFQEPLAVATVPVWQEAIIERWPDLLALTVLAGGLFWLLWRRQRALASHPMFSKFRLVTLATMTVFVGWYGQGQLSIVTPLATLGSLISGGGFLFLLYDPFSLLLWAFVLVSIMVFGRGFFCGWLCPYGALQEFSHRLGRAFRLPEVRLPDQWDRRLKYVKYGALVLLVAATLVSAPLADALVEVEPFKTAITLGFVRDWPFVVYALLWLVLGVVLFKPFCRYLCPLGAFLALSDRFRRFAWIDRRVECGSPCQLCRVRCAYQAIEPTGRIDYGECFQCLDCVTIHDDEKTCVPLVLARRRARALEDAT